MSTATVEIPADHVAAIRQSVLGQRDGAERQGDVDDLLRQIADQTSAAARSCRLTGSRVVLWRATYDSLCVAAEQLADDCNEYWRGGIGPEAARAAVAGVGARLELLIGLGGAPES